MINRRILHVIGFDYDGCLYDEESTDSIEQANSRLLAAINKQNEHAFDACFIFLSSNRQSYRVDELNASSLSHPDHSESRCFLPIKQMAAKLAKSTLCPLLLADAYADRPNGYAYTRAILRSDDKTAYHPDYVFDNYKTSLLYVQAHTAAQLARGCDFVTVNSFNADDPLSMLPFESNAAYLYCSESTKLFYVNRAQAITQELTIHDRPHLDRFLTKMAERIQDEEHDYEILTKHHHVIKGHSLCDAQLLTLEKITRHRHVIYDYPLIFDFYDDKNEILSDLANTFHSKAQRRLLPQNVMIRLCRHEVRRPNFLQEPLAIIQGLGGIDLHPKKTLVAIAKQLLDKTELDEYVFEQTAGGHHSFSAFFLNDKQSDFFNKRSLAKLVGTKSEIDNDYAQSCFYDSSLGMKDIRKLYRLLNKLRDERDNFTHYLLFQEDTYAEINALSHLIRFTKSNDKHSVLEYIQNKLNPHSSYLNPFSDRTEKILIKIANNLAVSLKQEKIHSATNLPSSRSF